MLSAVAARKARLQSKGQSSTPTTSTPQRSPSPDPIRTPKQYAKPPSKRKPSPDATKPPSTKRRKANKPRDKPTRYFQVADAFKEQDSVIVIEDDDEDDDDRTSEEEALPSSIPTKRAWSPSVPLQDSSDDEDEANIADITLEAEELEAPHTVEPQQNTPSILSTYRPIPKENIFDLVEDDIRSLHLPSTSPAKLLRLVGSDRLALIGTYTLRVLHGRIGLSGVALAPSKMSHPVYAPRSAPLPVIECLLVEDQLPAEHRDELPPQIRELAQGRGALVVLQELHTGVEGLGRICRTFENVFEPSRWQKNQSSIDLGLQTAHYVQYATHESQEYVLPPSWSSAISSILPALEREEADFSRHVYLVRGAKKCGKSTFAKTLLNNLVTRYRKVAFLECDIGQSEFTPGGMVALSLISSPVFGPAFTHPCVPYQAHYIGSTSPRNCPSYYLETIAALMQTYNMDVQHAFVENDDILDPRIADVIPLVVNMMGWTKGLGADLSKRIEETVEPSAVFEFAAIAPEDTWPTYQKHTAGASSPFASQINEDPAGIRSFSLEPIPPTVMSTKFSPADHRTLSVLSYFHAVFPVPLFSRGELHSEYATSWNTALPLCAQAPFELSAKDALDDVILIGPGSEDVVSSEIERVLNGAIVGLISCEPGAVDHSVQESTVATAATVPYVQGVIPPSPSTSSCHGLALVRSITNSSTPTPSTILHILTPLPPSTLADAKPRVIVKGEMELPVWGMLDFRSEDVIAGFEKGRVPFLQWGKGEGIGGERRRIRRNLMRRGQM